MAAPRDLKNADPPSHHGATELYDLQQDILSSRSIPSRHHVVTEQVGRGLLNHHDPNQGFWRLGFLFGNDTETEMDETWNPLDELSTVSMCGFGFFETLIRTGAYNRGRKS